MAANILSCSGANLEEVTGIDGNLIVAGSFSQYDEAKITGSGTIRFNQGALNDRTALSLKGTLDELHTSTLAAHFYSSSATLSPSNGIVVRFQRSGASVLGTIFVNGNSYSMSSSKLAFYYPTSLDLIIEVHNTLPARVLVWRRDVGIYSADTADIDTQRPGDISGTLLGAGPGSFTGVSLNLSTLSAAKASAAQVYP